MQISYHSVLTKIQKLQKLKKKKKKLFSVPAGTPGTSRYCPKLAGTAGTAGIFSGTKQGGRVYRITGWYGLFRPYRSVRYEIGNLVSNLNGFNSSPSPPNQGFARWKGSSKVWKENDSKWFYHCFSLPLLFFVCITCVFCFTLFKTI